MRIYDPFQKILLLKHLCPGCTHPLDKAHVLGLLNENKLMIQCKCKRIFILDKLTNTYRRATFEEEREFINKKAKIQ